MNMNKLIDHTLLKPDATEAQITTLCHEAKTYDFKSVCVNPSRVALCHALLANADVLVCTVIGFPLGATSTQAKVEEAKIALADGADEFDMVLNIGWVKEHRYDAVEAEIRQVKQAVGDHVLKVIIEACLLSDDEKVMACEAAVRGGADYVKTSTGFSVHGATVQDVELMKKTVGTRAKVKAAGGVRNTDDLVAMVHAGADRIGTSAGVKLMQGDKAEGSY